MSEARLDTVRLQRIVKGFWESAALMSAVELGVFTAIAKGDNTIARVANAVAIEAVNAERLLVALCAMELVTRTGETFTNAPDVERFLVEGSSRFAGPWMLFAKPRWDGWGRLTEFLRQGADEQRVLGMYAEAFDEDKARRYHEATYSIGMGAARRFHRQVDLRGRTKMMDLGGGSGCYCIVGTQQHPRLSALVLELAPVVPITREFVARHGLTDRIEARVCDFTRDPLPRDCDVAVMASNLPQYSREIIASVVRRVFAALQPGGEYHLIGEMLNAEGTGPHGPAFWGLSEAVNHSTGLAHRETECRSYLEDAGFVDVCVNEFIPDTLTRVTGIKPG